MSAEEKKEEGHEPKPKKSKGLLIGIIAVALIGLGVGGYLFFSGGSKSKPAGEHGEEAAATEEGHGAEGEGGEGAQAASSKIVALDPFIVNLQDNSGTRYLKLTMNLELEKGSAQTELNAQTTQIRDSIIILLSSKSYADIGTVEGKYQMRDEVVERVNQYLTKSKVKTAYFTEFVIQ